MRPASRRARRRRAQRSSKRGLAPGTPVYTGEGEGPTHIRVVDFDDESAQESEGAEAGDLAALREDRSRITWVNLDGVHDVERVQAVCSAFDVHPLWVEDIVNPLGRPKAETLDDQVMVVARMVRPGAESEQITMVMGKGWVLTFQERAGDVWQPLRHRIASGGTRIRRMDADYLLHSLLDDVVDHYFIAIEAIEARVDELETRALSGDARLDLAAIYGLKAELTDFRRAVWPLREAVNVLLRDDGVALSRSVQPYFRDLYDHVVQVMDLLESSRDRVVGVYELHLAVNGRRLNDIMKALTIVSTTFIPMTFIAGVYGMNFEYMPELGLLYGYPCALLTMAFCALLGLVWVLSRRWI